MDVRRHDPGWEEGKISGCGSGGGVVVRHVSLVYVFLLVCMTYKRHRSTDVRVPVHRRSTEVYTDVRGGV